MAAPAPQVLTANRLRDGDVVYWRDGAWVETFFTAQIFDAKPDADAALLRAGGDVKARLVVNPYLFPVRREGGRLRAVEEREIVRSEGPSVRRDLGKQAPPETLRVSSVRCRYRPPQGGGGHNV